MDTGSSAGAASLLGTLGPIEPRLRDALDHPVRRDILRSLVACGPQDLAAISRPVLSGTCTFSVLGYHARVLERADLIASVRRRASDTKRFVLSRKAAQLEVVRTLEATAAEDRIAGFRARASGCATASSRTAWPQAAMDLDVEQRHGWEGS